MSAIHPFFSWRRYQTPLGDMIGLGSEKAIHCIDFEDRLESTNFLKNVSPKTPLHEDLKQQNKHLGALDQTLKSYFSGQKIIDMPPLAALKGTLFQKTVWKSLSTIPYGQTWSYTELAQAIRHPKATRAVANANGKNHFSILIPCHRVIRMGGALGGYGGGLDKKQWLLNHEAQHA
ncbi:methylated-DNA--[protein]-cysteine S-methyltransferase [Alphaproteobacteria bacterium]|nr:methylated-DNA--[protein]-cysteine S-methyltransferase [Alphaproteobacteria bacterium]